MIILSLGSNLSSKFGDRFKNLEIAMNYLEGYGILIEKKSSFYETPSYPNMNDPKFINVIISVNTKLPPIDLMSVLIHIEEKLGRKRNKKNDPRTCDIDIIDYEQKIINFKYRDLDLIVPHERMRSRNFVLFPLIEIIPNWIHPQTKENISDIIKKLSNEDRKSVLKVNKT
tara:strand:- start:3864 stop:4376 length:513 start_codon:yes stop_codon:yes gene_type:complete